jgi:phosphoribosylaminoimidazole-succinocarboxamide synthase
MAVDPVITKTSLEGLPKIAEGKVRDLYEIDSNTLLFVASDRISAYDVIMENVSDLGLLLFNLTSNRAFRQRANCSHSYLHTGSSFSQP